MSWKYHQKRKKEAWPAEPYKEYDPHHDSDPQLSRQALFEALEMRAAERARAEAGLPELEGPPSYPAKNYWRDLFSDLGESVRGRFDIPQNRNIFNAMFSPTPSPVRRGPLDPRQEKRLAEIELMLNTQGPEE